MTLQTDTHIHIHAHIQSVRTHKCYLSRRSQNEFSSFQFMSCIAFFVTCLAFYFCLTCAMEIGAINDNEKEKERERGEEGKEKEKRK